MWEGLAIFLGLTGVAREAKQSYNINKEIARVGNPVLMGCKTESDFIIKKAINNAVFREGSRNHIPFTEEEFETMRRWERSGKYCTESVRKCYEYEKGVPLSLDAYRGTEEGDENIRKYMCMRMQCLCRCKRIFPNTWVNEAKTRYYSFRFTEEEIDEVRKLTDKEMLTKYLTC